MDNTIAVIPFKFQANTLRTVSLEGEHWFVAKDVAEALGYTNPSKAVGDHCKGVTKRYPLRTAGGVQEVRIIQGTGKEPQAGTQRMKKRNPLHWAVKGIYQGIVLWDYTCDSSIASLLYRLRFSSARSANA